MRFIIIAILALVLAAPAVANEERVVTGSEGWRLTYGSSGPASVDVAVNGSATIKFMWLVGGLGTDAGDVVKTSPIASSGNSTAWALRSTLPPRNFGEWLWGSDGPDSCSVVVDTATEVVVSW